MTRFKGCWEARVPSWMKDMRGPLSLHWFDAYLGSVRSALPDKCHQVKRKKINDSRDGESVAFNISKSANTMRFRDWQYFQTIQVARFNQNVVIFSVWQRERKSNTTYILYSLVRHLKILNSFLDVYLWKMLRRLKKSKDLYQLFSDLHPGWKIIQ